MLIGCANESKKQSPKSAEGDQANRNKNTPTETINTAAEILAKKEVPILCYHRIVDVPKGDYAVSKSTFNAHIKALADSGYHSITPSELYNYLAYNKELPSKPFLITFDDSRIEHFEIAVPILEKYGFRGAFFIMTITYNKKNYMSKDQLKELAQKGHTIGMHSWDHTMATKYKTPTDWENQVVKPKLKLEEIIGKPVEYWAYPNGVTNHESSVGLSKHFKLSFILSTARDTLVPLQTVRRAIITDCSYQQMLKSIQRTFKQ